MSQHDLVINNASGAAVRADLNDALAALGSAMKGPNAPPAPIAGMLWLDDDTPSATVWTLKLYDGADWLSFGTFNVSTNTFTPANAVALSGGALLQALLGVAGHAGAPSYSFSGDTDTGVFSSSPGTMGFSLNGAAQVNLSPNVMSVDAISAGDLFLQFRNGTASSAATRGILQLFINELYFAVAALSAIIKSDGSAEIVIQATPPGARTSDRRVTRMTIPGSGAVDIVGPVNVSSGGQSVTGDVEVSGNLRFNSGYGSAAVAYGVRAWVNFNGTGTVAIRASGNVTSITDNGTGDYTINLTNVMPDANYAVLGTVGGVSGASVAQLVAPHHSFAPTTSSLRILTGGVDSIPQDRDRICVAIVR